MGGAESTPERSADELLDDVDMPPEKRRNLRRNFNMLSDANQVSAGFGAAEWSSVVEPALAAALFQKMCPAGTDVATYDGVVRAVAAAMSRMQSSPQTSTEEDRALLGFWCVDGSALAPLPALSQPSELLADADLRLLSAAVPPQCRKAWRLVFSTNRDGQSFSRFVSLGSAPAVRAASLLVVRDAGGATFGGFASEPLKVGSAFFGDNQSFVYTVQGTGRGAQPAAVHRAKGADDHLVYLNKDMHELPNGLAFGGQLDDRFFGLWIHDNLESGRSVAGCATYRSPVLSSTPDFAIAALELWAVEPDAPLPVWQQEAEEQGGVMGAKHKQTREFMSMAGRELPSESAAAQR